ncbi:MAG: hypothetical protein JWR01_1314 [Subtercola sp.]|nr:hypothetical protein [Subtercola sp.]
MDPAVLRATFDDDIGEFERNVRCLLQTLRFG